MTTRVKLSLAAVVVLLAAGAAAAAPYVATAAFLFDMAGVTGGTRSLLPVGRHAFGTEDLAIPTRHGDIAARLYLPESRSSATVVVFPGVHGGGVDEPRLARLCGRLASTGLTVVCAPLPDLREFRITGRSTDMIEDVTTWTADSSRLSPGRRVGLVGVSFAGGLTLVAAGRPSLEGRLLAVMSLGGHGDIARTLRYLCTGELPDGGLRPPHDYGLAVVALAASRLIVPPTQVAGLEHAIRVYLEASLDATPEHREGTRLLAQAQAEAAALDEPARSLVMAITERDVVRVGQALLPVIGELSADPALSPERSPPATAPVFLVHGLDDNVIPSSETPLVAADLAARGNPDVHMLLTPLISHADLVGAMSVAEAWRLLRFWHAVRLALR